MSSDDNGPEQRWRWSRHGSREVAGLGPVEGEQKARCRRCSLQGTRGGRQSGYRAARQWERRVKLGTENTLLTPVLLGAGGAPCVASVGCVWLEDGEKVTEGPARSPPAPKFPGELCGCIQSRFSTRPRPARKRCSMLGACALGDRHGRGQATGAQSPRVLERAAHV